MHSRHGSTPVSIVLRKSVSFFIINIYISIIKTLFIIEIWPICCLNDSENQERDIKSKNPKHFLGSPPPDSA